MIYWITLSQCGKTPSPTNDIGQARHLDGDATTSAISPIATDCGNAATDAKVLASEFEPLPPTELVDQAPFRAWLRRGIGHEHVDLLPPQFQARGRLELVRRQSRRNFGRPRAIVERTFG